MVIKKKGDTYLIAFFVLYIVCIFSDIGNKQLSKANDLLQLIYFIILPTNSWPLTVSSYIIPCVFV